MSSPQPEQPNTSSPVALITGGGRRVGLGIAHALAARGYRLALHASGSIEAATRAAAELTAGGVESIAVSADLRDANATKAMVERVAAHFGRIDALVNNAAIWESKPLDQVTPEDVRRHFEINTLGTFVCAQQAGLLMCAQADGGAIVNIGDWAIERPYQDHAAYFLAKGSIPTLTRTLAVELGLRNPRVRVNAVLPGPILMPEGTTIEERRRVIDATLVKRWGTVAELAEAVWLLLSNSFITGVCLPVDGGRSIYGPTESD
jgi:pteridine reductase